jgi:hypothetical protein
MPPARAPAFAATLAGLAIAILAPPAVAAPARYAPAAADAAVARPLDRFELDEVSRSIPPVGRFGCPAIERVAYRGTAVRMHKPVTVARAFVPRVADFERVVVAVATAVYGRAPVRIRHIGGYNCRRMKTWPALLSEHAIGDAIDIEGFDFGPARGAERAAAPAGLRGAFQVRIARHWTRRGGERGVAARHAEFLGRLADALIARDDLFRVMLGPSYPAHGDHLHLDMSTFRMIEL